MIALAVSVFLKIYSINILYILAISNIHTHSHMYMSKESYYGHDFDVGAMNVIKCHILGGKKGPAFHPSYQLPDMLTLTSQANTWM